MAYKLKTTTLTGTQNFETYDEFTQFRSALSAYQNLQPIVEQIWASQLTSNVFSEKVEGGWALYRTISNKTEYLAITTTDQAKDIINAVYQANDQLGWSITVEVIEDN